MQNLFPLFASPIDLAHLFWKMHLKKGDIAIDATLGNGHDALFLSELVLDEEKGEMHCIDVQEDAILISKKRLPQLSNIYYYHSSHETLPKTTPNIIVYNLGYLPSGDKSITTHVKSTLKSLEEALCILAPSGIISITCYPGHAEGAKEEKAIQDLVCGISNNSYAVTLFSFPNRTRSPSLVIIQKKSD